MENKLEERRAREAARDLKEKKEKEQRDIDTRVGAILSAKRDSIGFPRESPFTWSTTTTPPPARWLLLPLGYPSVGGSTSTGAELPGHGDSGRPDAITPSGPKLQSPAAVSSPSSRKTGISSVNSRDTTYAWMCMYIRAHSSVFGAHA